MTESPMRVNWFSPLPPERSDIAHYTARLAPALLRHFDIVFWAAQEESTSLPPGAQVKRYDPARLGDHKFQHELQVGLNIYNFGNDVRFHSEIYRIAQCVPGIVILHDSRLHDFIFGYYRPKPPTKIYPPDHPKWAGYVRLADELYGDLGAKRAQDIAYSQGELIVKHVEEMSFVEHFLANAIGVICHSNSALADVRRCFAIPALELALPFASLADQHQVVRKWSSPFRLIMFGYFGQNRRLESILSALKDVSAEMDFHFDLFGVLEHANKVNELIEAMGLNSRVTWHGFVPEQELDDAIASAHLAFHLRHPTRGEASGGILRSWAHATPTLVTDSGWYANLSDDIVRKISITNEHTDLVQALRDLASNATSYQVAGLKAAEFVRKNHDPNVYAKKLAHALSDASEMRVQFAARHALRRVARYARSEEERKMVAQRATAQIASLFAKGSNTTIEKSIGRKQLSPPDPSGIHPHLQETGVKNESKFTLDNLNTYLDNYFIDCGSEFVRDGDDYSGRLDFGRGVIFDVRRGPESDSTKFQKREVRKIESAEEFFVHWTYYHFLQREVDQDGLRNYREKCKTAYERFHTALHIGTSPEARSKSGWRWRLFTWPLNYILNLRS